MTLRLDESLLDLSAKALRDAEFAELSLGGLAARVGVSKPTLYRRFGSKNGLIEALVEHEFSGMLGTSPASLGGDDDPAEALRAYARELFEVFLRPSTCKFVRFLNQQDVDNPRLVEMRKAWHLRVIGRAAGLIASAGAGDGPSATRRACLLIDLLGSPVGLYSLGFDEEDALFGLTPEEFFETRFSAFLSIAGLDRPAAGEGNGNPSR